MDTQDWVKLGLFGVAAYLIYQLMTTASTAVTGATNAVSTSIADAWVSWTSEPAMSVSGNMVLPDGSLIPLAAASIKQSPSGLVYAQYGGAYYELSPSDANGNWPATPVQ